MPTRPPRRVVAVALGLIAVASGAVAIVAGSGPAAIIGGAACLASAAVSGFGGFGSPTQRATETEVPSATVVADRILDRGLFDVVYVDRVASARRTLRPLSVVALSVSATDGVPSGALQAAGARLGSVLSLTLREADLVGSSDGVLLCVLDETDEDGAVWTAERVRRELGLEHGLRFRAGVATYPTHGLDAGAVRSSAMHALELARAWSTDRIEVAES